MLLAVAFCVAPEDVAAITAATSTTTRERATMLRLFIWKPPESGGPVAQNETRRRAVGTDHLPLGWMLSQCSPCCQYQSSRLVLPGSAQGRSRGDRDGRGTAEPDLRHEPVAIAAIGRARELDHLAGRGSGHPLEEQRRRVERHTERRRLLLVRHRRLHGLGGADDRDPVAVRQEVVERVLLEILRRQPGDERGDRVQQLHRHRIAVRETEALDREDLLARRDVEDAPEARAGELRAEIERPAPRRQPTCTHVVAEGRDVDSLCDLRLRHERAGAAAANEIALTHELVERRAHRQPRDTEVDAELPFRGDGVADAERLDELQDALARLALLGQAPTPASSGAPVVLNRSPVAGSKKWKRAGSTASLSRSPTRAAVRASTRAVNSAWLLGSKAPSAADSSTSAVIGGASTWKKMCASEPSSSTTATSTSTVGRPGANVASSKLSGRIPSTKRPAAGAVARGTRYWPKRTAPSS